MANFVTAVAAVGGAIFVALSFILDTNGLHESYGSLQRDYSDLSERLLKQEEEIAALSEALVLDSDTAKLFFKLNAENFRNLVQLHIDSELDVPKTVEDSYVEQVAEVLAEHYADEIRGERGAPAERVTARDVADYMARLPENPLKGERGPPGTPATLEQIVEAVREIVTDRAFVVEFYETSLSDKLRSMTEREVALHLASMDLRSTPISADSTATASDVSSATIPTDRAVRDTVRQEIQKVLSANVSLLKGDQGPRGPQGPVGPPGPAGERGPSGSNASPEQVAKVLFSRYRDELTPELTITDEQMLYITNIVQGRLSR